MHIPVNEFRPWTAARFASQEARDQFLLVAGTLQPSDVEVQPILDDGRGAMVRWRSGQFLGLNDVAYAHGGRIILSVPSRRGA